MSYTPLVEQLALLFRLSFLKWSVTLSQYFRWKSTIQQPLLGSKAKEASLSYDVDMLTDDYFVLSQCARLTDGRTDGQNSQSKTVRCITCSRTAKTALFVVRKMGSLHLTASLSNIEQFIFNTVCTI